MAGHGDLMRAAVLHARADLRIEEVSVPTAGPGELLLRVEAVGICGTDAVEYARGPRQLPLERPGERHVVINGIAQEFDKVTGNIGAHPTASARHLHAEFRLQSKTLRKGDLAVQAQAPGGHQVVGDAPKPSPRKARVDPELKPLVGDPVAEQECDEHLRLCPRGHLQEKEATHQAAQATRRTA
jgi:hypothetical protein